MVTSKRGRMSSADREKIHALAERGLSVDEIAAEVERRADVVEAILGKNHKTNGRGRRRAEEERPASRGRARAAEAVPAPVVKEGRGRRVASGGTLEHLLWVRPGFQIQLTLPADLSEHEAERLSVMVRNLPFSQS